MYVQGRMFILGGANSTSAMMQVTSYDGFGWRSEPPVSRFSSDLLSTSCVCFDLVLVFCFLSQTHGTMLQRIDVGKEISANCEQ